MIVNKFDPLAGIYSSVATDLVTGLHTHPALEIIVAKYGHFTIQNKENSYSKLTAVLVRANQIHAINATGCQCNILLAEPEFPIIDALLSTIGQPNNQIGIVPFSATATTPLTAGLVADLFNREQQPIPDQRVLQCLQLIRDVKSEANLSLETIAHSVHLSASRISHLFKQKMGISIQKYIIWTRLKATVELILKQNHSITDAAHTAGFYDLAHFSRNFKEMIGVTPSAVYNSRIVQDWD